MIHAGRHRILSGQRSTGSLRTRRTRWGPRTPAARFTTGLLGAALAATGLAACGTASAGTGPVTLNFYNPVDNSGAIQQAAENCTAQSHGKYRVIYNRLPLAADQQRLEMARRLAAKDPSLDILGLDVTWEAEFATAGWIIPWTGTYKQQAMAGTLAGPLQTATWHGQLVAVPDTSNTQLLWYRSDLVKTPPKTWAEMIADAEKLAKQGKPHYIEIQGAQYEGTVVWFNSLLQSAGGSVLNAGSTRPALGPPAVKALSIMKQLAASPAADPSLSVQMEDANRLAMEAGTAAFELNYPFVWPSMQTDKPSFYKAFKYAPYPGVDASTPAKVTIGGIDLAISKYSLHPNLAFQAALCLRDRQNQKTKAIKGGLPPTLASLYSDPAMQGPYPFRKLILASLQNAAVRPKTPAYQVVSVALSHLLSPPANIVPTSIEQTMKAQVNDALQGKGLTP